MLFGPPIEGTKREKIYNVQWIPMGKKSPKDKVVWYQFREPLPAVSPGKLQAPARPRVDRKAIQQIVAAPAAKPGKQFVWMPAQPEVKIQQDIRTATLLAIDIPLPPAPPKPKPRIFVPPVVATPKPVDTRILPAAPEISGTAAVAGNSPALMPLPGKPKPKAFQPPPQVANGRPLDNPAMPVPPGINSGAGIHAVSTALDQNWMQPAPRPMPREQTGASAAAGANVPSGAEASVAAISVDPVDTRRIPQQDSGERVAVGPDASGTDGGSGVHLEAHVEATEVLFALRAVVPGRRGVEVAGAEHRAAAGLDRRSVEVPIGRGLLGQPIARHQAGHA
jgi:hypothetical protein